MTESLSVVVTDDDGVLRQLIKLVLEASTGFTVVGEASDAEACISAVRTLQPDVVLLDLGLPGLPGLDAIPQLKVVAPGSLVIVLSAHDRAVMAPAAQARGADGYLEKGNLVSDLVPTLTAAVEATRQGASGAIAVPADVERLAAVAAHDLRGHLLGISGYAQLLARSVGRTDPAASLMLEQLLVGTGSALALVDDLQAYATCSWRQGPPSVVDLDELVAQVAMAQTASVTQGPLGQVRADPVLVRHLLLQLLANAVAYVAPGTPPEVEIAAERVDGRLQVRVDDNGLGILAHERETVFEPFQRGSASKDVPGTGLGLAICQTVVSRYGGSIRAQESPSGGTSMIFTLPLADGP